jgi:hypothetical protein
MAPTTPFNRQEFDAALRTVRQAVPPIIHPCIPAS